MAAAATLAYVSWHRPRDAATRDDYEACLRAFHEALWTTPIAGLQAVAVYRLGAASWAGPGAALYEDWHLLEHSGQLDSLNAAAVDAQRRAAHDRIAAQAGWGTAGLYRLRLGRPAPATIAYWLSKPGGMSYPEFLGSLDPLCRDGAGLWGRQMTLGPTPEFCLLSARPLELPYAAEQIALQPVFSHGL